MSDTVNTNTKYEAKAIEKIIGEASRRVPGVLGPGGGVLCSLKESSETIDDVDLTCGVTAKVRDDHTVDAEILLTVDAAVEDMTAVMDAVKVAVIERIQALTDLRPGTIAVEIVDTETAEDYAARFKQA